MDLMDSSRLRGARRAQGHAAAEGPVRAPGEVLVKPVRVGICGTDYHIYEGNQPFLDYPRVMGHELAVEMVEAEMGSGFAAGDICVVNPYLSAAPALPVAMASPIAARNSPCSACIATAA